ncbi:hypothetical protein CXG46_14195 [Nocardioides alpinus]|uniref:Uncharacterized protein n=1 Tax=Nocardioides alpinus TaxID=748909 RepID=A0ABX4QW68_9ACTN|nr:hypothetical protein CXG46_14195 [Nocardioides alpinus]
MGRGDGSPRIVVAPGQTDHHHGRDPDKVDWSLCGAVPVTAETLRDDPFLGTGEDDCHTCAERLRDLEQGPLAQ